MALNDLLKGFKRMALRGALGLALVSPMVQGCGDEGDTTKNYYGGDDTQQNYCETACEKMYEFCGEAALDEDKIPECIIACKNDFENSEAYICFANAQSCKDQNVCRCQYFDQHCDRI